MHPLNFFFRKEKNVYEYPRKFDEDIIWKLLQV